MRESGYQETRVQDTRISGNQENKRALLNLIL
jgi:hypothetical protein